jgi:putative ABC transport system substrate-binding protein
LAAEAPSRGRSRCAHSRLIGRLRLPTIYAWREFAPDGGLVTYGIDRVDQYRNAAAYVDRILRGARPGELPIQQPTKFELVINM